MIESHPGSRRVGRDWICVAYLAARGCWGRGGIVSALALGYFVFWGGCALPNGDAKKKAPGFLHIALPALISNPKSRLRGVFPTALARPKGRMYMDSPLQYQYPRLQQKGGPPRNSADWPRYRVGRSGVANLYRTGPDIQIPAESRVNVAWVTPPSSGICECGPAI